jgi:hypothetical protein
VATAEEEQKKRRSAQAAWIAATIVFVSILAGTAFSYLRG